MPDRITCYKRERDWIKVPNGITGFYPSKFISTYDSQVIEHPPLKRVSYDYQERAIGELTSRSVGLLHASTGSGKTQMICDITNRLKRNTLILVQNLGQMAQMVDDIYQLFGVIPTQVSGKKPSIKQASGWYPGITVCSIDSRDKVQASDYGLILLDEADCYLGSDDRREWVGNLSPEYMYALTGTVKINDMDDSVFELYYGPTTRLEMLHLTPHYVQVLSNFRYQLDDMSEFHELKAALYSDEDRNRLVISTVAGAIQGGNKKGIVFTEHVEHAKELALRLSQQGIKTYILIGEVSKEERERIRQEAKDCDGSVVIVGSVKIIGRGFDLPELSFAVLTTAEKFESNLDQYVGRIIRKHDTKAHPIFYDITDHAQYLLNNQSKKRLSNFKKKFANGKIYIK